MTTRQRHVVTSDGLSPTVARDAAKGLDARLHRCETPVEALRSVEDITSKARGPIHLILVTNGWCYEDYSALTNVLTPPLYLPKSEKAREALSAVYPGVKQYAFATGSRINWIRIEGSGLSEGNGNLDKPLQVVQWPQIVAPHEQERFDPLNSAFILLMDRTQNRLSRFARSRRPLLLTGAMGTGKSHFAEALHHQRSAKGDFAPVNLASIPDTLLSASLYGIKKGVASDVAARTGLLDALGADKSADAGTLFLDELHALSPTSQALLLTTIRPSDDRVEFTRIGDNSSDKRTKRLRIIAGTYVQPSDEKADERIRADLLQRFPLRLHVRSLAEMLGDSEVERPARIMAFLVYLCDRHHPVLQAAEMSSWRWFDFDDPVVNLLAGYSWPGGMRQLESLAISLHEWVHQESPTIGTDGAFPVDLSLASELLRETEAIMPSRQTPADGAVPSDPSQLIRAAFERAISDVMAGHASLESYQELYRTTCAYHWFNSARERHFNGNASRTAAELGIGYRTWQDISKKYAGR